MSTGNQPLDTTGYLIWAVSTIAVAVGINLFIQWRLEVGKAGSSRRKSRHRRGVRFHKPTHIPVQVRPQQPVAFSQARVRPSRTTVIPVTEVLPKIEVKDETVRK